MNDSSILVVGSTGVVGAELVRQLRRRALDPVCASRSGRNGSIAWDMSEPAPPALRRTWDVVVNAAASTRWTMTREEAWTANVSTVRNLADLLAPTTRFVHLSTAHVGGLHGSIEHEEIDAYRNTYEWSKAASERWVRDEHPDALIVRFPIVIGRRSDGNIERFSGLFKVVKAVASGLLPAIVGVEDALLDVVPVDDVARIVIDAVDTMEDLVTIGRGPGALRVRVAFDLLFDELDAWRAERRLAPLVRPPLVSPERWERFFLPFARQELSEVQLRVIDVFAEFQPYLKIMTPFPASHPIDDVGEPLRSTLRHWADTNERAAGALAVAWS